MAQIIAMHSHRGGTGRSTIAANLARLMADEGHRVALVDTDIQSPAAHVLFGDAQAPGHTLADYLIGRCEVEDAAVAMPTAPGGGDLFLVPARAEASGIHEIIAQGYDVGLLREGFDRLIDALRLDILLLDTHAGINNETVTAVASADTLVVVTRSCRLDLTGAGETIEFANQLSCPRRALVVNMVPPGVPDEASRERAERAYGSTVEAVLPYTPELAMVAGARLFADAHPEHPLMERFRKIIPSLIRRR
ncbi:MinD/ParA family protein [Kitasatospora sp. MAP5-34]|uniref:MinD/ParA family ATP-binding protein n=1 Tax=Kitasatospora sp. MAP5-34 TaxID=3035102 RepID=UPI0024747F5B|nr:MinD/ParA family protein [Kitasatospora sp. MAP5-34]MDH6574773.1 MinD-like ATPase involved in chromosome partitioning or flagellar assembly [Kitasatospora sp. MAP5-34]